MMKQRFSSLVAVLRTDSVTVSSVQTTPVTENHTARTVSNSKSAESGSNDAARAKNLHNSQSKPGELALIERSSILSPHKLGELALIERSSILSPQSLAQFRLLMLAWHGCIWGYQTWIWYCEDGDPVAVTFTHNCYLLFLVYFAVAAAAHFRRDQLWLAKLAPPMFSVCLTFQLGSTLIYWPILFRPEHVLFLTIHSHLLNLVAMLTELSFNSLNVPWSHMKYAVAVGFCYFPIAWGFYYFTGRWVYFFLNVYASYAVAWYVGLILVFVACFGIGKLLVKAKSKSQLCG